MTARVVMMQTPKRKNLKKNERAPMMKNQSGEIQVTQVLTLTMIAKDENLLINTIAILPTLVARSLNISVWSTPRETKFLYRANTQAINQVIVKRLWQKLQRLRNLVGIEPKSWQTPKRKKWDERWCKMQLLEIKSEKETYGSIEKMKRKKRRSGGRILTVNLPIGSLLNRRKVAVWKVG